MALKLKGSTSGFVAIDAPSVAGNNTLILPENTGSAHQILANDITAGVTTFTQVTVSRNGDLTVPGTISIGGTLTYEDVTSVDSVGIITARTNIILGDSLKHLGDENTLISFPANDTITAETSGTEALRIDSSGNVNLGASAANTAIQASGPFSGATPKLEIKLGGASNSYTRLINIANPSGATGSESLGRVGIKLALGSEANSTESVKSGIIYAESTSTYNNGVSLCLATNNAERMRITSAGKIGIGSAVPTAAVDIASGSNSYFKFGQDADNPKLEIFRTTGNASNTHYGAELQLLTGDFTFSNAPGADLGSHSYTERFRIKSSGYIGVGVDPSTILHVKANVGDMLRLDRDNTGAVGNQVAFRHSASGTLTETGSINCVSTSNAATGELRFATKASGGSNAERMRISSNGDVRVGGGVPATFGSGTTILETYNASTYTANLVTSGTHQLQMIASQTHGATSIGTRSNHNLNLSVNDSTKMTITTGGIVNISSTGNDLTQTGYRFQLTGSGGGEAASMAIKNEGSHPAKLHLMSGHGNWSVGNSVTIGDALEFRDESGAGTRMYIDSAGNAIFNHRVGINFANPGARFVVSQNANQLEPMRIRDANNTNAVTHYIGFRKADSEKGSIKGDRGGTSFNTTSDYRLKQNVTSISDGITRIKQLLPKKFSFIEDETNTLRDGFLAHEVSSLVPEAVDGTKDAVDSDNKPIHQQIDHSKLVPLLTAALQEEIAKRESLEARVAALEG